MQFGACASERSKGVQHWFLRPGLALFHAEALFAVVAVVFLATTGDKHLHDLHSRQIQSHRHSLVWCPGYSCDT
jgi:hypothetical protein